MMKIYNRREFIASTIGFVVAPCLMRTAVAQQSSDQPKQSFVPGIRRTEFLLTDFAITDQRALRVPASAEFDIRSLAAYLTREEPSELLKVRAIYRWITSHVTWYGSTEEESRDCKDESATTVFTRRTTGCAGFAALFDVLARESGIVNHIVSGHIRDADENGVPIQYVRPHTWNIVRIEGGWYLIDASWSVRGPDGSTMSSKRGPVKLEEFYFLADPEKLIYTHVPDRSEWQVLREPMSEEEIRQLIRVDCGFFDFGLEIGSHREWYINSQGQLLVWIGANPDVQIKVVLSQHGRILGDALLDRPNGGRFTIPMTFTETDDYILRVYARSRRDKRTPVTYYSTLAYSIHAIVP